MTGKLYSPLGPEEIRLVTITSQSPLQLQLQVVSLSSCPPFTSLSYVWGSRKSRDVEVRRGYKEFHTLSITRNLRRALRRLCGSTGWFWIDAICIDQFNLAERSSQVPLMRQIYSQSKDVIVYLGEVIEPSFASPANTEAPSGKVDIYLSNGREEDAARNLDLFGMIRILGSDIGQFLHALTGMKERTRQNIFEALRLMMHFCQWWNRVWVLQEIVLPEKVTVIYGPMEAPWTVFAEAANVISQSRSLVHKSLMAEYAKVLDSMSHRVLEIEDMRRVYRESGRKCDLLLLLRQFSGRKATDERDKVYALLGMTGIGKYDIKPNYVLPASKVFQNTVVSMVAATESLDPISGELGSKYTTGLPSWTPDWSVVYGPLDRARLKNMENYRASLECKVYNFQYERDGFWSAVVRYMNTVGPVSDSHPPGPGTTEPATVEKWHADMGMAACLRDYGNGLLSILGSHIDTVAAVGDPVFPDTSFDSILTSWWRILCEHFQKFVRKHDKHELPEAFQRTICGDLVAIDTGTDRTKFRRMNGTDHKEVSVWLRETLPELAPCFGVDNPHAPQQSSTTSSGWVPTSIRVATSNRRLFITDSGYIGLGPTRMATSDSIFVLLGGKAPFVLRDANRSGGFVEPVHEAIVVDRLDHEVIGDCYVHGVMDGEQMPRQVLTGDEQVHAWIWHAAQFAQRYSPTSPPESVFMTLDEEFKDAMARWRGCLEQWEVAMAVDDRTRAAEMLQRVQNVSPEDWGSFEKAHERAEQALKKFAASRRRKHHLRKRTTARGPNEMDLSHAGYAATRSRLQGIESELVLAEEQLRIVYTKWSETVTGFNGRCRPRSDPEVREASKWRRDISMYCSRLTKEWWEVAHHLWMIFTCSDKGVLVAVEDDLLRIGREWVKERAQGSNERQEEWRRAFQEWDDAVHVWADAAVVTLDRGLECQDRERSLYEAEERLYWIVEEIGFAEDRASQAGLTVGSEEQKRGLGVKRQRRSVGGRPGVTGYVYLV